MQPASGSIETLTFRELDDDSNLLADGLASMGVRPGMRLVLMVPPSIDFISLVFAMFKAGVVTRADRPGHGPAESDPLPGRERAGRLRRHSAGPGGAGAAPRAISQGEVQRHRRPPLVLGRQDDRPASRAATERPLSARGDESRRSGGDHLHHRQHRPAQGRALSPRQLQPAGRRDSRLLRHPAGRDRPARLSAVRAVQLRDGRDDGHSRHGPDAAGQGRSAEHHRSGPRLERDAGLRLAGAVERRRPLLRRAQDRAADAASACSRPARRCRRTCSSG